MKKVKRGKALCILTAAVLAALGTADLITPGSVVQAAGEAAEEASVWDTEDGIVTYEGTDEADSNTTPEEEPSKEPEEEPSEEPDAEPITTPEETPSQSGGSTAAQKGQTMKLPVKLYEWLEGEGGEDWYLSQHLELDAFFTANDPAAVLKTPRNDDYFWADGVTMDYSKQYVEQSGWKAQTLDNGYSVDCLVCVEGLSDAIVSGSLTIPVPSGCDASTAKYAAYGSASYVPVSSYTDGSVTFSYTYDPAGDHYANYSSSTVNYVVVEFVGSEPGLPSSKPTQSPSNTGNTGSYKVLEGADAKWTKGSADGMTIKVDGAFEKFQAIKIDGKAVDPANYTVKSGSTIITLKNSYLKTLGNGKHELTVVYTDGEVSTRFTIAKATSPKTGDGVSMMVWLLLAGASGAGLLGSIRKRFFC